jgi:hypothetical protein
MTPVSASNVCPAAVAVGKSRAAITSYTIIFLF